MNTLKSVSNQNLALMSLVFCLANAIHFTVMVTIDMSGRCLKLLKQMVWQDAGGPLDVVVVVQSRSCVQLCDYMDCRMPGSPVLHYLPEFAQIHVH